MLRSHHGCGSGRTLQLLRDLGHASFRLRHRLERAKVILGPFTSDNSFLLSQFVAPIFRSRLLAYLFN
jgi:hypothetical protein